MNLEELDHIEQELKLTIPEDYRSFMLEYPFLEYSRPSEELYGSAKYIVHQNLEVRKEVANAEFWRDTYFVSGVVGLDTYYVLDCEISPSTVLQVNLRTGEVVEDHQNFWIDSKASRFVRQL